MKRVGVPDTPLRSAVFTSSAIRAAPAQVILELLDGKTEVLGVPDQVGRSEMSSCSA
jgi:hypothetical protein